MVNFPQFASHLERFVACAGAAHDRIPRPTRHTRGATSPVHAKEAFLVIGGTLRAAGWEAVPYHDNVPSFGEWGWYLARPQQGSERLAKRGGVTPALRTGLQQRWSTYAELPVPTRYLTLPLLQAALHFGRDGLSTDVQAVTDSRRPAVYEYYRQAARQVW